MSSRSAIRKYIVLAVSGAVIIGIGTFLLLNSFFERVDIVVAKTGIAAGQEIEEDDVEYREYYSSSLPAGYIEKKTDVIGRKPSCGRQPGDPVTEAVFLKESVEKSMIEELGPGEVLMALDVSYTEPLIGELKTGSRISIVSTEKEKSVNISTGVKNSSIDDKKYDNAGTTSFDKKENNNSSNYGEENTYQDYSAISPNIIVIDSQVIIKNLEIIDIKVPEVEEKNLLVSSRKANPYIFIKCSINEAPVISRITKEDKYKIFMERM